MAENKRPARGIRITDRLVIALAVIVGITLISAVLIVPKYAKTLNAYKAVRADYKAAEAELTAAQETNAELSQLFEDLKALTEETKTLSEESFALAAQVEKAISEGTTTKKICYFTLDDGPYNRGKEWLELFKKYDIKATFFLSTANGNKLPDQADLTATSMYPEYLKYGHTIGNHSYSHAYGSGGIYRSAKAFMADIEKQTLFTEEATGGYKPQIVRCPGGTSQAGDNRKDIENALRKAGYVWIDWTIDSGDSWGSEKASVQLIKDNIMEAAMEQDIMVVLMHEWSKLSLEAMPEVIEYLQDRGFIFLPLFPESIMVNR